MLPLLRDYAARLAARGKLPPTLYAKRPVRYWIDLTADGDPLGDGPQDTADADNRAQRRGIRRLAPTVQRTAATRPLLLADTAEYTFGYAGAEPGEKAAKRAAQRHAAYLELLAACHEATGEPAVGAVLRFLESSPLERMAPGEDFDASASVSFRVDGQDVVDLPPVMAFWADSQRTGDNGGGDALQCLVCGETRPAERRLKEKIKGIPGGQTAGTALISANAAAFSSYGLEESLIAPVCGECGERFTKGINALLASEDAVRVGDMAFVSWTREPEHGINMLGLLRRPNDFGDQLDELDALPHAATPRDFASQFGVRQGKAPAPLDEGQQEQLYAAGLSAAGGRAAVRSWHAATVGEAVDNARRWYDRQKIAGAWGERPWTDAGRLGLIQLAGATVRELRELPSTVPRALVEGFLAGGRLPEDLLIRAVRRTQAERGVRRNHAALIKMVLRSQPEAEEEDTLVSLDRESANPAYNCGRLLAELENAQRKAATASGQKINATIVDRFFGKASTAPGSVFGRLVEGAQPHLSKLERDRPTWYRGIQEQLEEIMDRLAGEFPGVLTPREQGEFVLGYYHQRASNRAEAAAARANGASGKKSEEAPA